MTETVQLDPTPWIHPHFMCPKCGDRVRESCKFCIFSPRAGYSQNREDYR